MKELSIEQKAQRYDEAVDKLRRFMERGIDPLITRVDVQDFFPELKESEDERIRKRIIQALHGDVLDMEETTKAIAWLEKQGLQKPADKVEPKFKVGDWVYIEEVDGYKQGPFQIKAITKYGYTFDKRGGVMPFECESLMTPWTIADAKDGDVLTTSYYPVGISIFIFKRYKPSTFNIVSYCFVNSDGVFKKNVTTYYHRYDVTICPATKEQRDTLMKAMADAGYTFDFEKKELKKIEQKLAEWSKEDEEYLNFVIATMKTLQVKCTENEIKRYSSSQAAPYYGKVINWLKSLKPQPKQEWKQENTDDLTDFENAMMHIGGSFFGQHAGLDPNDTNVIKEQANLLLELVPKQEWSEKDTEILNGIANYLFTSTDVSNVEGSDEWYDWLKSLKNRVQKSF